MPESNSILSNTHPINSTPQAVLHAGPETALQLPAPTLTPTARARARLGLRLADAVVEPFQSQHAEGRPTNQQQQAHRGAWARASVRIHDRAKILNVWTLAADYLSGLRKDYKSTTAHNLMHLLVDEALHALGCGKFEAAKKGFDCAGTLCGMPDFAVLEQSEYAHLACKIMLYEFSVVDVPPPHYLSMRRVAQCFVERSKDAAVADKITHWLEAAIPSSARSLFESAKTRDAARVFRALHALVEHTSESRTAFSKQERSDYSQWCLQAARAELAQDEIFVDIRAFKDFLVMAQILSPNSIFVDHKPMTEILIVEMQKHFDCRWSEKKRIADVSYFMELMEFCTARELNKYLRKQEYMSVSLQEVRRFLPCGTQAKEPSIELRLDGAPDWQNALATQDAQQALLALRNYCRARAASYSLLSERERRDYSLWCLQAALREVAACPGIERIKRFEMFVALAQMLAPHFIFIDQRRATEEIALALEKHRDCAFEAKQHAAVKLLDATIISFSPAGVLEWLRAMQNAHAEVREIQSYLAFDFERESN
jgi:hypothetical protein